MYHWHGHCTSAEMQQHPRLLTSNSSAVVDLMVGYLFFR